MTLDPHCLRARQALQGLLFQGQEPDSSMAEHWTTCPDCRALAVRLREELDLPIEAAQASAPGPDLANTVRREARRRLERRILGALFAGGALASFFAWALKDPALGWSWGAGMGIALIAMVPAALLVMLARLPRRHRLYKRLKTGRMLSGVCLGLAERSGLPVWAWRTGFIAGSVVWMDLMVIYAFLALLMPVHPEDRAGLLRFRLARFFRRRWSHRPVGL